MYAHHQRSIQNLKGYYEGQEGVIAAVLDGSVVKGTARPDSDIDAIVVVTEEKFAKLKEEGRMTELVFGGYAEKKYDDGSSVCCTVTVKGRAFNAELKALSLRSDDAATVVKADAVGRPVVVFDNKDAGFRKQIRKIAGSSKSALVFGLIGGIVGGVIGGVIVALITHFALA